MTRDEMLQKATDGLLGAIETVPERMEGIRRAEVQVEACKALLQAVEIEDSKEAELAWQADRREIKEAENDRKVPSHEQH